MIRSEFFLKAVEERPLARQNSLARFMQGEPRPAIHFRKVDRPARARRPLHLAVIARKFVRGAISFKAPGRNKFPSRLADGAQLDEFSVDREPCLFFEFAPSCRQRIFIGYTLAFGNRPCPEVLLRPQRPARMNEKDFDSAFIPAIEQQTCTGFWHALAPFSDFTCALNPASLLCVTTL